MLQNEGQGELDQKLCAPEKIFCNWLESSANQHGLMLRVPASDEQLLETLHFIILKQVTSCSLFSVTWPWTTLPRLVVLQRCGGHHCFHHHYYYYSFLLLLLFWKSKREKDNLIFVVVTPTFPVLFSPQRRRKKKNTWPLSANEKRYWLGSYAFSVWLIS